MSDVQPNTYASFDDKLDSSVPSATLQIYEFIENYLGRKEHDSHINRASSASLCYKRRWYQGKGFKGEPLTPRKIVNFALGDLSEEVMKFFIANACVGPGKLYSEVDFGVPHSQFIVQHKPFTVYKQEDLTAQVGDITVTAHVDGWGKRNSDDKWELIECKSAADYGFDKFKTQGPEDYLKQAHVNMRTEKALRLGADSVRFFYLRKNTGHLWDRLFTFDHDLYNGVIEEYKIANGEMEPPKPYVPVSEMFRGKPTGRKVLYWACAYCPYTLKCHPTAVLEFKNDKPLYVVR
jgi:hypothetical protein